MKTRKHVLVSGAGCGRTPVEARSNFGSVARQEMKTVATVLVVVMAVGALLVQAGHLTSEEVAVQAVKVPTLPSFVEVAGY